MFPCTESSFDRPKTPLPTAKRRQARRSGQIARRGLATVELALCLPFMLLIVFGSIEACTMIFVQEALQTATYEGARAAIKSTGTTTGAIQIAGAMLTNQNVAGGSVTCSPANVSTVSSGSPITVTATAPCNSNLYCFGWFFKGRTLTASTTMVKEF